ncbi:MAG: tRNA 2-thiocytidine biosynthesis TtcA family protein [Deltaproteobacteria bacterium]|jgi:tRNA(Ile)-lysidine synthase TilS/MesJ|nr:tRNA 2-thiocytidine biosynthesis TtcA family protein [Deltaproteobacteria bacterium]
MAAKKYTYAQEVCIRAAGRAMQSTEMIWPGARVGVAVSGGMDSWALLQVLRIRQGIVPFPFEIMALHVNPGFDPQNHAPLLSWLEENKVPGVAEATDHGLRAHSEENRKKSACFYCAMLRRKRLFQLCDEHNLTHLAFGHNADDLVGNFFMNLVQTGRVSGLSMKEAFFGGRLQVIRPLLLVEKAQIAKAVKHWDLPVWSNPCPSAGSTGRSEIMTEVERLCAGEKRKRKNVFNGICRWQHAQHTQGPSDMKNQ